MTPAQAAAKLYRASLDAFRAGAITADQHRADNRSIRECLTDTEWQQVKLAVTGAMAR